MSELAKKLFESLRPAADGLLAGLQQGAAKAVSEIGQEAKRMTTQGSMELASALFGQGAFVPYGPGQYTPSQQHVNQQERGIER